jgi:hypothetical protein
MHGLAQRFHGLAGGVLRGIHSADFGQGGYKHARSGTRTCDTGFSGSFDSAIACLRLACRVCTFALDQFIRVRVFVPCMCELDSAAE